jgi:hypothetical protein
MCGKRNPCTLLVGMQAGAFWNKIWRLPKNLNIDLPYDPAIPLLGIYPKGFDTGYSRGTCTPMFIAANGLRKYGIYAQWNFTQP